MPKFLQTAAKPEYQNPFIRKFYLLLIFQNFPKKLQIFPKLVFQAPLASFNQFYYSKLNMLLLKGIFELHSKPFYKTSVFQSFSVMNSLISLLKKLRGELQFNKNAEWDSFFLTQNLCCNQNFIQKRNNSQEIGCPIRSINIDSTYKHIYLNKIKAFKLNCGSCFDHTFFNFTYSVKIIII